MQLTLELTETSVMEYSGQEFFSRSLFRSPYALLATILLTLAVVGSCVFCFVQWHKLSVGMKEILFIALILFPLRCLFSAVALHKRVRTTYFIGERRELSPQPSLSVALDVAAKAIVEDMLYASFTFLTFLFVCMIFLAFPPK